VAVDIDATGRGWTAGVPTGFRAGIDRFEATPVGRALPVGAVPAPLVPVSASGADPGCAGPAPDALQYSLGRGAAAAYLWSDLTRIPGSTDGLAGGQVRPGLATATSGARNDDRLPEPVVMRAACDGTLTRTRFRVADPTDPGAVVPADRGGVVQAVAATAPN